MWFVILWSDLIGDFKRKSAGANKSLQWMAYSPRWVKSLGVNG